MAESHLLAERMPSLDVTCLSMSRYFYAEESIRIRIDLVVTLITVELSLLVWFTQYKLV